MSMYHWARDQEDFLLLRGEALLGVEGEERPLRARDLVQCPAGTRHVIVRRRRRAVPAPLRGCPHPLGGPATGVLPVEGAALCHGAGVDRETTDPHEAYARFPHGELTGYRDDWLPA